MACTEHLVYMNSINAHIINMMLIGVLRRPTSCPHNYIVTQHGIILATFLIYTFWYDECISWFWRKWNSSFLESWHLQWKFFYFQCRRKVMVVSLHAPHITLNTVPLYYNTSCGTMLTISMKSNDHDWIIFLQGL